MSQAYVPHSSRQPSRRRKKSFFRRYWPLIKLVLLLVSCIVLIVFTIKAFSGSMKTAQAQGETSQESLSTETAEPSETQAATDTAVAAPPDDQTQALIAQADQKAAGYDYQGAIALLQSCEGYDSSQALTDKIAEYQTADSQLTSYPEMSNITHVFFHSLIVDTARAFDGDSREKGYNQYMTTVSEFNKILQSMYDRGYVLVSPYDVAYEVTDEQGTHFTYGNIRLPAGKKPFVMSQDDVNYYGYMISGEDGSQDTPIFAKSSGDGFADKIVIGDDGYPTCEYMDANGNVTTGDYDLVPLLEAFIREHPDFSYHGARAILAFTGYEGVMGYRTKPAYEAALGTEAYQQEVQNAKDVAQCLRDHGWVLASHSYGHIPYGEVSAERVEADSDKWESTVEPIIGPVDILVYPHGSDIAGVEKYTSDNAKFVALYNDGFRYFYNVDSTFCWNQMGTDYFRGNRRNLDGYRMSHNPDLLTDLFDVNAIFDPARPLPVPDI
ncbi:MAG: polysaccharide deacetylase [Oscillospiraceae bacterium]|nr:polysaccharide deacetylase [Oscillospiraceae bacterium]